MREKKPENKMTLCSSPDGLSPMPLNPISIAAQIGPSKSISEKEANSSENLNTFNVTNIFSKLDNKVFFSYAFRLLQQRKEQQKKTQESIEKSICKSDSGQQSSEAESEPIIGEPQIKTGVRRGRKPKKSTSEPITNVNLKTNEENNEEPKVIKKKSKQLKKRNMSIPCNYMFFNKNDYIQSPTKQIFTPEWGHVGGQAMKRKGKVGRPRSSATSVSMHQKLEVYENRILLNKTCYQHPAYSVQLEAQEKKDSSFELNEEEKQKMANYNIETMETKIPLFWEKRSWDKPDDMMKKSENKDLVKRIEKDIYRKKACRTENGEAARARKATAYVRKQKINEPKINFLKETELDISNYYFETDDSGDETDFEMF